MKTLRKVLFLHAAVWGLLGVALALFSGWFLDRVSAFSFDFDGPVVLAAPNSTLARLIGVQAIVLAMFMVLVAQKIESVWWWSWAFVLADVIAAGVTLLHVLFGLLPGEDTEAWWVLIAVSLGFAAWLIWGLFKAAQDQPIIDA